MNSSAISCGLYTRVSTRNQAEEDYNSLETQRERLEAYCKSQGNYVVYRVYEDGGYSGEKLDRPALKEMLRVVRDRKISCVLAYKIDRLTRSVKDFHALMDLFDQYGVKFVSVTQSFDTQQPMGRLLRNVLLDFAQFEREITADRTRDKMNQRAEKGLWNGGLVPYGYACEAKRLLPHAEEGPQLRFMFESFSRHGSLARLQDEVNRRGWPTRRGNAWSKASLQHVLRNPVYLGSVRFNDKLYKGLHEALVDEALFRKVQGLWRDRRHVKTALSRVFLLKGLLKCSDCGSFMSPHYTQKRRKDGSVLRIPYYRCTKTMHFDNSVCRIKHANAADIEAVVVRELCELGCNEAYVQASVEELNRDRARRLEPLEKQAARLRKRLREIEAEIGRYVGALGRGKLSVERLEEEIEARQGQKTALEAELEAVRLSLNDEAAAGFNADLVLKSLRDFRAAFNSLAPQEQAEALQCAVKDVILYPDKLVVDVFELAELLPGSGSQNRKEWLLGQDSNLQPSG